MENYVNLGACCRIISNTSMDLSIEVIVLEIRIWHGAEVILSNSLSSYMVAAVSD